jgi:serine/threonine-protein kinase RsbW
MNKIFDKNITGNTKNLKITVSEFLSSLHTSRADLRDDICFDIKVILNELLINAIKHGNKSQKNNMIKIIAALTNDCKLMLVVEDSGTGYCFSDTHKKLVEKINANSLHSLSENGRGIMIVKSLSDRIRVNERGNQIIVLKNLN